MTDISSSSGIHPTHNGMTGPVHRLSATGESPRLDKSDAPAASAAGADGDRVELSDFSRFMAHLRALPPVRFDRVEQARQSILNEVYVTEEKIDVAINRWAREEL